MVGTNSTSMKDFMSNGIVGKLSFFKDMFYLPNNVPISSYMCPTNMKFSYISQNMPLATNKDRKQNTNRFLLSPATFSICTFKIGGNGVDGVGVLDGRSNDVSYIFPQCNNA
jgi:hypothetical protein